MFEALGVSERQGVHWREGGHGQEEEDWMALLDFCDLHLHGNDRSRSFADLPYEYERSHQEALEVLRRQFG